MQGAWLPGAPVPLRAPARRYLVGGFGCPKPESDATSMEGKIKKQNELSWGFSAPLPNSSAALAAVVLSASAVAIMRSIQQAPLSAVCTSLGSDDCPVPRARIFVQAHATCVMLQWFREFSSLKTPETTAAWLVCYLRHADSKHFVRPGQDRHTSKISFSTSLVKRSGQLH